MMIDLNALTEDHGRMTVTASGAGATVFRCGICGREVVIGPGAAYRAPVQGNPLASHWAGTPGIEALGATVHQGVEDSAPLTLEGTPWAEIDIG